jgi:hypothetical protein
MFIDRFVIVLGFALLWLPSAHAEPKPKPGAISACNSQYCIAGLVWRRPAYYNTYSMPHIEGLFVNRSEFQMSNVSVSFALKSGETLRGTAPAFYLSEIPPGGRWSFQAAFQEQVGTTVVTRTETAVVSYSLHTPQGVINLKSNAKFDPVFNLNLREWRAWEKIHGKRQR